MDAESQLVVRPAGRVGPAVGSARPRRRGCSGRSTVVAGIVWAILQPYRITLLHPRGQGFWFLFVQPPLLVIAAGVVFAVVVARPLVADLEAAEDEARDASERDRPLDVRDGDPPPRPAQARRGDRRRRPSGAGGAWRVYLLARARCSRSAS